jgi:hypothetical protein
MKKSMSSLLTLPGSSLERELRIVEEGVTAPPLRDPIEKLLTTPVRSLQRECR